MRPIALAINQFLQPNKIIPKPKYLEMMMLDDENTNDETPFDPNQTIVSKPPTIPDDPAGTIAEGTPIEFPEPKAPDPNATVISSRPIIPEDAGATMMESKPMEPSEPAPEPEAEPEAAPEPEAEPEMELEDVLEAEPELVPESEPELPDPNATVISAIPQMPEVGATIMEGVAIEMEAPEMESDPFEEVVEAPDPFEEPEPVKAAAANLYEEPAPEPAPIPDLFEEKPAGADTFVGEASFDDGASMEAGSNNKLALTSVISSGIAWVIGGLGGCAISFFFPPALLCTLPIFLIGTVAGTITGHMGLNKIKESGEGGRNLAITGLSLGWVGIVLTILSICIVPILLVLLGPAIGDVFGNIIQELQP